MGSKHLTCLDISENAGKCPASISEIFHNMGIVLYRQGIDQETYHLETISNIFYCETKTHIKDAVNFYCCQVNLLKIENRDLVNFKEKKNSLMRNSRIIPIGRGRAEEKSGFFHPFFIRKDLTHFSW